jgi:hypothetical protein
LKGRTERCAYHRLSGFEGDGDRTLRPCSYRNLRKQGRIGRFPLEQPAKIKELHQAEREAVLEGRVQREVHEQVLARRQPLHEADPRPAAFPGGFEVEREKPGARGDPLMELDNRAGCGIEEATGMLSRFQLNEASFLEERNRPGPVVEYQQIDVRHGAMSHGVVEALGNRGTLEREATHPALPEEILNPVRRIELTQPKGKSILVGVPEGRSSKIWPADPLLSDRVMKKAGQTLLPCCL